MTSAILLGAAGLLGMVLVALHAGGAAPRVPPWWAGAAHGLLGAAGLAVLLIALRGPTHGARSGADQFGVDAALLFAATVLSGLGPVLARLRRRAMSTLVLGLHATFAIMGLVVLAAYL